MTDQKHMANLVHEANPYYWQIWVNEEPMGLWFSSYADALKSATHLHGCKNYADSTIEIWAVSRDGTSQRGLQSPPHKILGGKNR